MPNKKEATSKRRKVHPKLRLVENGGQTVNLKRAERAASVATATQRASRKLPRRSPLKEVPVGAAALIAAGARRGSRPKTPSDIAASVFVTLAHDGVRLQSAEELARRGNLATATVRLDRITDLEVEEGIVFVEPGTPLQQPRPIIGNRQSAAPRARVATAGPMRRHRGGESVLVGIVDVGGFDFAHRDFVDSGGGTRFVRIWDQGGASGRPAPTAAGFDYGSELTKQVLDTAIRDAALVGAPAHEIERQSQMSRSSHGTHVASIAAGNSGICPKAGIAGVLIALPAGDIDGRRSFYDSTRVVHAVDYLVHVAQAEGYDAVSINISLGTNGHAHDASDTPSRWIDAVLTTPGRCVCIAAGNAGQEAAEHDDDIGFITGRIHTSGRIPATGLSADIEWVVVGNGIADLSENELEIWYGAQDRFDVLIRPPDGAWIGPIEPGQFIQNRELEDHNSTFLSIYNDLYHPANGENCISLYLSPFLTDYGVSGVQAGLWTVRLVGSQVRSGSYHGWIERDDPLPIGRAGSRQLWRFPSFFSSRSNVDNSSVSSMACGHRIISVANYDPEAERINISSSQGPTRDGRPKPEVAAPGTNILAANGFDPDQPWVRMTGTSMASPYVAGVAGLMLAVDSTLTAAQIGGIIKRTAKPLPNHDFDWRDDAGFGRIDIEACLTQAALVNNETDVTS